MGDPRGFLKVKRAKTQDRSPAERVADYREIVVEPSSDDLRAQASRCMECGIPFCHGGCPLGNVIPEFNDLVWRGRIDDAARVLASTNNFPEVTGRVCPAPCEASCVLAIDEVPVTIKDIERTIARSVFSSPRHPSLEPASIPFRTGKRVAVVGSGPAGLAAAQQLARLGHDVSVYERDDAIGGLLRYGIPDFKLEKDVLDRRVMQMEAEGVRFLPGVDVGRSLGKDELLASFDAVVLCIGARVPRDLPVPGRELDGVHFAMTYLEQQNRRVAGRTPSGPPILAEGKHVVVIGGGDTGSDCVGTANRQGAKSVTQLELMPKPPLVRMPENPWPAWPLVLRTSSSQEEPSATADECKRRFAIMTTAFGARDGRVATLGAVDATVAGGRVQAVAGSEHELPCDLALLAMGFVGPESQPGGLVADLGLPLDARGNIVTDRTGATGVPRVYAAGDASRGQSLVVWAIADGRRVAAGVHAALGRGVLRAVG
jgi:glutamate synthase (NADPH/NADH) small chain